LGFGGGWEGGGGRLGGEDVVVVEELLLLLLLDWSLVGLWLERGLKYREVSIVKKGWKITVT